MASIKEVSKQLGISAHSIRFYEKEGLFEIPRNERGIRTFDAHSIEVLKAILHYRSAGVALGDIKKIFASYGDHELSLKLLEETKTELDLKIKELEATRTFLNYKIDLKRMALKEEKEREVN